MEIIFCSNPLYPRQPDSAYDEEVAAIKSLGLSYEAVSNSLMRYLNEAFA